MGVQIGAEHDGRRGLRRQQGERPADGRQSESGGAEQHRRNESRWQARRPIPKFGDITEVFNGGKSWYNALQMESEWRTSAHAVAAQLVDALEGEGQRDSSRWRMRTATSPGPQDIHNLTADYGTSGYHQPYNSTTSVV